MYLRAMLLLVVTVASLTTPIYSSFLHQGLINSSSSWNVRRYPHITEHSSNNSDKFQSLLRIAENENNGDGVRNKSVGNGIDLKVELTAYLEKREEMGADEAAKRNVGKVIGGTKGNAILEYISGSPNKPYTIEAPPDIFDYDELTKYGFGYLVTPIMDAGGGRRSLYALMDLPLPPVSDRIKPKKFSASTLVFDRTGEGDEGRYTGLKVTQILDDEEMGRKLEEVRLKEMKGESLRKRLIEEDYDQPFSDKRNTSPPQTPEWTPAMLDEEGIKAGKAIAWARAARAGEFQKDPYERLNIEGRLQVYSILTIAVTAFAFGKATPSFLSAVLEDGVVFNGLGLLQGLAYVLVLNAVLAGALCGGVVAPQKNRNGFIWGVKGLAGGPLAIVQLRGLDVLRTRGDIEEDGKDVNTVS